MQARSIKILQEAYEQVNRSRMHSITKPVMNERGGEQEDDDDINSAADGATLHIAKAGIWSVVNGFLRGNLTFIGKDDKVYTLAMVDKLLQSATNKKQLEHVFGLLDMERYMGGDAPAPFDPSNNE